MPTAEVKQETATSQDVNDPFIKAVTYLKYKLKNLDQRKKNLELLKEKVDAGQEKDMELGQVQAITKLPEVSNIHGHLEQVLVRLMKHHDELLRQEKTRKQQLKQERQNNDLQRVYRVLLVQDVLNSIDDRVRDDLLNGRRGAPKLTDEKLNQLDEMFKMVTPSRDNAEVALKDQMLSSAEHLLKLADYSQKKVLDTTYEAIARLLDQVSQSGVLEERVEDAAGEPQQEEQVMEDTAVADECCDEVQQDGDVGQEVVDGGESTTVVEQVVENGHQGELVDHVPHSYQQPPAAVVAESVAAEAFSPPTVHPTSAVAPPPAQHHQQPSIQFLQDSELAPRSDPTLLADPAVVGYSTSSPPAATSDVTIAGVSAEYLALQPQRPPQPVAVIPTQTFTNSNYATAGGPAAGDSAPNPPPPIPMPRRAVEESTCWADEPEDPPVHSQRQPTVGGGQWAEMDNSSTAAAGDDAWKQPQQDDWATAGAASTEWTNSSSSSRQYDEARRGGYRGGRGGQNGYYGGGGGRGGRPYRGGGGGGGGGGYRGGRGGYGGGGGGGDRRGGRRGGGGGGDRPYRGGRGGPRQ